MSEPAVGWLGDAEAKPAPEPLTRIQALINTVDLESGADRLAEPADARPWLVAHGLLAADRAPTADELATVRAVREALRAMVVHNAGGPVPTAAELAPLRRVADTATARARLDDDGTVRVDPVADAQAGRLLALLLVVAEAQRDGTWQHLKVGVLRPLAQPRRHLVRHGDVRQQAQEPGVPGAAQPRRALKPAVRSSTGATPGRRPARPAR